MVDWLRTSLKEGEGSKRWPDDGELLQAAYFEPLYTSNRKAAEIVLRRLERSLEEKEPVSLEQTTIEHVMPQSISEAWKEELGEDWEAIHKRHLHCLANLTLTAYNGTLGNMAFQAKREKLAESPIRLNAWIASQDRWNNDTLVKRATILATQAQELWRHVPDEDGDV
jgi:hypothetical protein